MIRALFERRPMYFSVSLTTRPPRAGEEDGVHYHFVDEATFRAARERGELLEWASYSGHLYGTPRLPVLEHLAAGEDVLLDIEIQGALQVKAAMPTSATIFVMPPSLEELERRLQSRGDTTRQQLAQRLEIAREQIESAPEAFDHLVVNESVEATVGEIERILEGTRGFPS